MFSESTIFDLIGRIYDAAEDPGRWPLFLSALSGALRGASTAIDFYDFANQRGRVGVAIGISDEVMLDYVNYFAEKNVLWLDAAKAGFAAPGVIVENRMLLDDETFARTEYCSDFLQKKMGVFHVIGGSVIKDDEVSSNLSILRKRAMPIEEGERQLLRTLMPHLRRSLSIHRRIAAADLAKGLATETIERLPGGTIVLDETGKVTVMNGAARTILDRRDGLRMDNREFACGHRIETERLRGLIAGAMTTSRGEGAHPGGIMTITRPSGKRPLVVMVTPLRCAGLKLEDLYGAVAIFITDPDQCPVATPDALRTVHGLTPSEARFAARLLQGQTVAEAAESCGVTVGTGRTHLKHVMAKTNTRRQGELLLLLNATVRNLPHPEV